MKNRLGAPRQVRKDFNIQGANTQRGVLYSKDHDNKDWQFSAIGDPENKNWDLSAQLMRLRMPDITKRFGPIVSGAWQRALDMSRGTNAPLNDRWMAYHDKSVTNPFKNYEKYYNWTPEQEYHGFIPYTVTPKEK